MISDTWCTIIDMGEWDLIFEESEDKRVCELFIEVYGFNFDKPLEIKLKKDVRKVPTELINIIRGSNSIKSE